MTDLRQRAERIAKKYKLTIYAFERTPDKRDIEIADPGVVAALLEMAAEARREAIEECAPKWISIKEQRPPSGDYLAHSIGRGVEQARYFADDNKWETVETYGYAGDTESLNHIITHWMSLEAIRALLPAAQKEETP